MIRALFDESEGEFYLRVQNLRAARWTYPSPTERQLVLDYLASYRKIERPDPALKSKLYALLDKAGF